MRILVQYLVGIIQQNNRNFHRLLLKQEFVGSNPTTGSRRFSQVVKGESIIRCLFFLSALVGCVVDTKPAATLDHSRHRSSTPVRFTTGRTVPYYVWSSFVRSVCQSSAQLLLPDAGRRSCCW